MEYRTGCLCTTGDTLRAVGLLALRQRESKRRKGQVTEVTLGATGLLTLSQRESKRRTENRRGGRKSRTFGDTLRAIGLLTLAKENRNGGQDWSSLYSRVDSQG